MQPLYRERRRLREQLAVLRPPAAMPAKRRFRTETQEKIARCPRCGGAYDFVERCIEADRRCSELRAKLVMGEVSWEDAATEYAKATAPLAAAVAALREAQNTESSHVEEKGAEA